VADHEPTLRGAVALKVAPGFDLGWPDRPGSVGLGCFTHDDAAVTAAISHGEATRWGSVSSGG
jgi:hypothetical protein